MRRLLIPICALVVLASVAAGVAVSTRLGPDRLRAELERQLVAVIGPAEIDAVRPHYGWGLGIAIEGIRSTGEPGLEADTVWITLSPRSLLRREPVARRIDVRGLRVHATQHADGTWDPPVIARLLERMPVQRAPGSTLPVPRSDMRDVAQGLPALTIEGGELTVTREHGDRETHFAVRDLEFELHHDPLGGAPRVRIAGRFLEEDTDRGRFEVLAAIERTGVAVDAAITDADLGVVAPWLAVGDARFDAAGRVSGTLSWKPQEKATALVLDLLGFDVRLAARAGNGGGDVAATFPNARLHVTADVDPRAVRVGAFEWSAGSTTITGTGSLERPFGDASKLAVDLRGDSLPVTALRDAILAVAPKGGGMRDRARALRAGNFANFSLRANATPLAGWKAFAADPLEAWPEGFVFETKVANVELELAGSARLRDISGLVRVRPEHLEIEGARARTESGPLPELWLSIRGLRAVAAVLNQGAVPEAVPALPGRVALVDWIESHRRPGSPPRWRQIDVDAEWIEHPALLRPIEEFTARLEPANPGVHIQDAKGFWGGVPFEGEISFVGGEKSRVDVDLALSLPRRDGRRRSDAKVWLRSRFRADLEKLGDFQAEELSGVVQAIGARVELRHGEATLRPRGDLSGGVELELSRADAVPYYGRIKLVNGSLSELMNDLKMDGGAANGSADIDIELNGLLIAGRNFLADTRGPAALRLRDGEILKRMNVLFSIAQASDTLNPFRSRETIPYETIDAPLQLGDGFASTEAFSLQGPALRLVGTGRVNLVEAPHIVEAVIGIFYFRALDRVIGAFPLLNRWFLGSDDNLVSSYFAVSGPWSNPSAALIPSKSFASGPGSFLFEGLPSFVRGGLSTLQNIFTPGVPDATPEAGVEPAPPAAAPPPPPPSPTGDTP